ncbi:cation diffusion facilitator family transporter [Streptococcus moroccensis]|uniref:Cobalt-zinc-cadmium efflux system protein n=1 Tax=Streptococcus moroccensis TaxID=1451356 RepID=A0ABT9YSG2_9STRE|nr:cation diffusion facilitator family transporter [Streptococcus moroccensis]MDQ0222927.1 cobalt-zinc-cadmium efflux system protein [Streptococcus moroccensis]
MLSIRLVDKEKNHRCHHHHDHHLSHHLGVDHDSQSISRQMGIVGLINLAFAGMELFFAGRFRSTALFSDAIHDLGDAIAIGLSWFFEKVSGLPADDQYPLGYRRFSLLGALISSSVMIVGSLIAITFGLLSLRDPWPVNSKGMLIVGVLAVFANLVSTYVLRGKDSVNGNMLNLHLLEDVLGWIAVILVALILQVTDWYFLDPLLSIGIGLTMLIKTVPTYLDICQIFLTGLPKSIELTRIYEAIEKVSGVSQIVTKTPITTDGRTLIMGLKIETALTSVEEQYRLKKQVKEQLESLDVRQSFIEIIPEKRQRLEGHQ